MTLEAIWSRELPFTRLIESRISDPYAMIADFLAAFPDLEDLFNEYYLTDKRFTGWFKDGNVIWGWLAFEKDGELVATFDVIVHPRKKLVELRFCVNERAAVKRKVGG